MTFPQNAKSCPINSYCYQTLPWTIKSHLTTLNQIIITKYFVKPNKGKRGLPNSQASNPLSPPSPDKNCLRTGQNCGQQRRPFWIRSRGLPLRNVSLLTTVPLTILLLGAKKCLWLPLVIEWWIKTTMFTRSSSEPISTMLMRSSSVAIYNLSASYPVVNRQITCKYSRVLHSRQNSKVKRILNQIKIVSWKFKMNALQAIMSTRRYSTH